MKRSLHGTAVLLSARPWWGAAQQQQQHICGPAASLLAAKQQQQQLCSAGGAGTHASAFRGLYTLGQPPSTEALAAAGTLGLALNVGLTSLWSRLRTAGPGAPASGAAAPAAAVPHALQPLPHAASTAAAADSTAAAAPERGPSALLMSGGGLMPNWGGLSRRGGGGGWGGGGWFSRHPATNTILLTNVAMFALQQSRPEITLKLARINHLIASEPWRLLTPALLHGNLFHLLINSFSLYMLGPSVEEMLGKRRFAAVYAASAVAGNALGWVMGSQGFVMAVGASTSISGLFGAYVAFRLLNRGRYGLDSGDMWWLAQVVGINALILMGSHNVDGWSHLGGALGGALTVFLLGPRPGRW